MMNISDSKTLKNNFHPGFFTNLTERGWALLNEKGLLATDCYNCNKYGNGCDKHLPEPCSQYGRLKFERENMNR